MENEIASLRNCALHAEKLPFSANIEALARYHSRQPDSPIKSAGTVTVIAPA
jgi:hypothetical protein